MWTLCPFSCRFLSLFSVVLYTFFLALYLNLSLSHTHTHSFSLPHSHLHSVPPQVLCRSFSHLLVSCSLSVLIINLIQFYSLTTYLSYCPCLLELSLCALLSYSSLFRIFSRHFLSHSALFLSAGPSSLCKGQRCFSMPAFRWVVRDVNSAFICLLGTAKNKQQSMTGRDIEGRHHRWWWWWDECTGKK